MTRSTDYRLGPGGSRARSYRSALRRIHAHVAALRKRVCWSLRHLPLLVSNNKHTKNHTKQLQSLEQEKEKRWILTHIPRIVPFKIYKIHVDMKQSLSPMTLFPVTRQDRVHVRVKSRRIYIHNWDFYGVFLHNMFVHEEGEGKKNLAKKHWIGRG